jgi:hypothetical protein
MIRLAVRAARIAPDPQSLSERPAFRSNQRRHRERQRRDPDEGGSRSAWMTSSLALPRHEASGRLRIGDRKTACLD